MSIQISDCTIRDGGYLTNKYFTDEFINGIIAGLIKGGIDYIEVGFMQNKSNGEPIVYSDFDDAKRNVPSGTFQTKFVGFCDNSRYSIENLTNSNNPSFNTLRISFAKHEMGNALKFCEEAIKKGYKVFVQPMDAPCYSYEERKELIQIVNSMNPEAFSIVDTFGSMHLYDLTDIFNQVSNLLNPNIKIGLHSHNNLHLSCALVEQAVLLSEKLSRDIVVDSSLLGMGRGAGNACTEAIADLLNKRCGKSYDMLVILETIEQYILPIKSSLVYGVDLPMFMCGMESAHVDNISYLKQSENMSIVSMYQILHSMSPQDKKRYGSNYSKNNFSVLKNALETHKTTCYGEEGNK